MRSAASSYAAMHMVAGSRPVFVIAWEWHIGLALLCGCSGALEYPTTNSWRPINKSLSLSLSLILILILNPYPYVPKVGLPPTANSYHNSPDFCWFTLNLQLGSICLCAMLHALTDSHIYTILPLTYISVNNITWGFVTLHGQRLSAHS